MADDNLRMRAVVEDGFSAPLADLRKKLRGVNRDSGARTVDKDWKAVNKTVGDVANTLRLGVAGGFRAIGISSLAAGIGVASVGAALGGTVLGIRKLAGETRSFRMFTAEVGLSIEQLRRLKIFTDHFGMSWDTAQGSLKTFSNNLFELQRNWGEAYNQLRGMNLAGLAEDLSKAPNMEAALNRALEGIKNIKNPVLQRRVAEILLGTDQWAVIARESASKLQKEIAEALKALPAGSTEAADKFAEDMTRIGVRLENLRTQFLGPLLPPFERFVKLLQGSKIGGGVIGGAGSFLGSVLGSIMDGLEYLTTPGGRSGTADQNGALAQQLKDRERQLGIVTDKIEQIEKGGGTAALPLQREQEKLRSEVEKLRKALEQANRDGALQKSSFGGAGFGGGGIINAAYRPNGGSGIGINGGHRFGSAEYPNLGNSEDGGGRRSWRQRSGSGGDREVPPGSGPKPTGLSKNKRDVARIVAEEWRRAGMSENGLAGLMANIGEESNFNPTLRHPDQPRWGGEAHYAHGLYQEGGAEWNRYADWLKKNYPGADWRDPRLQSRFAAENLKKNYPKVWSGMRDAKDRVSAGELYAGGYLKPRADYLASRKAKFRRNGIPSVEHYTGAPPSTDNSPSAAGGQAAPAENTLNLLREARRADAAMLRHRVEGSASVRIDLNGLPEGSKVRSSTSGLFRDVQVSRGRPMELAGE